MAKADRLARLDDLRLGQETDYRTALIEALRRTAAGKWGLFDHQADRKVRAAIAPVIDHLEELGDAIDAARDQLGLPPFELRQQFLKSRGPVGPQAMGEPRQAQAWLDRLAAEDGAAG